MKLKSISIKNFRKIEELLVNVPPNLCVFLGENNIGKTAIIDALRLILFSSRDQDTLYLNEDDYRKTSPLLPIEISLTFDSLSNTDEARFIECLVQGKESEYEIQINFRAEFSDKTGRSRVKLWGGETEGGSLPSDFYEHFSVIYLQPLRDPQSGLRPSRNSKIARLIKLNTSKEREQEFEAILQSANQSISVLDAVKESQTTINSQYESIAGKELFQHAELIIQDPSFSKIISGIEAKIDGMSYSINGLGYNNLFYTAVTLGTLKQSSDFSFRAIIVEEPEAHLHPQLQTLFLQYLNKSAECENPVQIFLTSHSPIIGSQAKIDSIVALDEADAQVTATSICSLEIPKEKKRKLERYLNSTRAELFFARKILMVEGIAEAIVIPEILKKVDISLSDHAVTILNVEGINFDAFVPLFSENGIQTKVAILSDGDAKIARGEQSASATMLEDLKSSNLTVSLGSVSFEHELFQKPKLREVCVEALRAMHPQIGNTIDEKLAKVIPDVEKADLFYKEIFRERKTSKGIFAQEFAERIRKKEITINDVPDYILEGLRFLGINCDE